jgi:hypothetical protein
MVVTSGERFSDSSLNTLGEIHRTLRATAQLTSVQPQFHLTCVDIRVYNYTLYITVILAALEPNPCEVAGLESKGDMSVYTTETRMYTSVNYAKIMPGPLYVGIKIRTKNAYVMAIVVHEDLSISISTKILRMKFVAVVH